MKRYMLLLLVVCMFMLTACVPTTEESSSEPGIAEEPISLDESSEQESMSSEEEIISDPGNSMNSSSSIPSVVEPSSKPSVNFPPASESESASTSEPASMEQVLALQEYLFDTLPQDSYAYLNAGAQEGFLTIGYTDLDTIKSVVNDYNGSPCPIIYSAAECSVADTLDFLDKINENIDFPGEAYIEPVSDIPGAFEGARLGIHASNDEQAQEIEDEILALAKKTNFPQKYLKFYHMALGYNPDT